MKSFKVWIVVGLLVATFVPLGGVVLAETADEAVARVNLPKLEAVRAMLAGLQSQNENKLTIGKAIVAQLKLMIEDQSGDVTAEQKTLLQGLSLQVDAMVVKFETDKIKFTTLKSAVDSLVNQLREILGLGSSSSGSSGGGGGGGGNDDDNSSVATISNVAISGLTSNTWTQGQGKEITWTSTGLGTSPVTVAICNSNNVCSAPTINTNIVNDGSHPVILGLTIDNPEGGGYYVKVTTNLGSESSTFGKSASFNFARPPAISNVSIGLTSNNWPPGEFGSSKTVRWNSSGLGNSNVHINICGPTGFCKRAVANTANDGTENITFPFATDDFAGKQYYVKVLKYGDTSIFGQSSPFSVSSTVTSSVDNLNQMASILSAMEQLLLDLQSQ